MIRRKGNFESPERKYELTDETKTVNGHKLHRIRALKDFRKGLYSVNVGDLGGWIESEENLSHGGLCWLFDESCVYDKACVYDEAFVYGSAQVYGDSAVFGNA